MTKDDGSNKRLFKKSEKSDKPGKGSGSKGCDQLFHFLQVMGR